MKLWDCVECVGGAIVIFIILYALVKFLFG